MAVIEIGSNLAVVIFAVAMVFFIAFLFWVLSRAE